MFLVAPLVQLFPNIVPQRPSTLTIMGTFADVLAQLRAADVTSLAPKLASMGIRDMDQLNGMTPEQIMGVATTYTKSWNAFVAYSTGLFPSGLHRDPRISEQTFPPHQRIHHRRDGSRTPRCSRRSSTQPAARSIRQQYPEHPGFALELVDTVGSAMGHPSSSHHDRPCQRHRGQPETRSLPFSATSFQHGPPAACRPGEAASIYGHRAPHQADAQEHRTRPRTTHPQGHRLLLVDVARHGSSQTGTRLVRNHTVRQDGVLYAALSQNRYQRDVYHQVPSMHVCRRHRTPMPVPHPRVNGGAITHEETIQVFRTAIEATGAQLTRPGPQGQPLQRFNEHVCRVSGAQFLTRLGYPMETVQLIGRWGSDAVKRYVQDTPPSCATGSTSARTTVNRIPTQKAVQGMVKKYLEAISGKCWIKNTSTNVVHISGAPQFSTENIHWHTLCGWKYGSSPHTPFWTMPEGNKCQRCFKLQETPAITDVNSDEETIWNAPTEAF